MPVFTSVRDLGGVTPEVVSTFLTVMRAHERAVRPDLDDLTSDLVLADLDSPTADLDQSGIWSSDGEVVMVAIVNVDRPARNVGIDAYGLPSLTAPDFVPVFEQGRTFARALAESDSAAQRADGDPHDPDPRIWQIQMFTREEDRVYRDFLSAMGLKHVRNFHRMTIDLNHEHAEVADYPGLSLVPAITEELQRELKDISTTSFAHHWGSTGVDRSFEEWKALRENSPGFEWERAWVVQLDGQSAGLLICSDLLVHESTDYIWTLGVLEEFRGRGIASWLLRWAFQQAHRRGLAKAALNVDAENATGAVRLYESVGMRPTEVYVAYRGPVL